MVARRLRIDANLRDLFAGGGGIILRTVANAILSRRERKFWQGARFGDGRRIEWLCGRLVAKETLREYLLAAYGLPLCPADIEIHPDERGRPLVSGAWTDSVPGIPHVSISHSNGIVVAIASDASRPVGVDIEPVDRLDRFGPGGFEKAAFSPDEQRLIDALPDPDRAVAALRVWCAKEAAAKARGIGLSSGLLSARAESIENRDGGVVVQVRIGRESAVSAWTTIQENYIVAICTDESAIYQETL